MGLGREINQCSALDTQADKIRSQVLCAWTRVDLQAMVWANQPSMMHSLCEDSHGHQVKSIGRTRRWTSLKLSPANDARDIVYKYLIFLVPHVGGFLDIISGFISQSPQVRFQIPEVCLDITPAWNPFPILLPDPPMGFLGHLPDLQMLVSGPTSRTIQTKTYIYTVLPWPSSLWRGKQRIFCLLPDIIFKPWHHLNLTSSLNPVWWSLTHCRDFQAGFNSERGRGES